MGYRKVPTIYELAFEEGDMDGLVVKMKSMKLGRIRRMVALTSDESVEVNDQQLEEMIDLFVDGLVTWNLEDEDGNPIPATREGVEDQEAPFILAILSKWLGVMTGVPAELGKDSTSGQPFPGGSPTMDVL